MLGSLFLLIQSWTPARRIILLIFRRGFPFQLNLSGNTRQRQPEFRLSDNSESNQLIVMLNYYRVIDIFLN